MTKLKQSLGLVSGFLAVTTLGGCLTNDDSKSSSNFAITTEARVTGIVTPVPDSGIPGVLSTVNTSFSCEDGEVEVNESPDNYNYAISGGALYLWEDTDCTAMKFSGTSSTIKGTWTSTDLSARLPSKYRSGICDTATLEDNQYEGFLKDAAVTYTISSTKIKGTVKGQFCYAAAVVKQFEDNEDFTVSSDNCSTAKLKNNDVGLTATITMTYKDNKITQIVAYNGKTCKASIPVYLGSEEPTCSEEADEAYQEEAAAFTECLEESEFNDDFNSASVPKASAQLRKSIEQALERATPF